MRQQKPIVRSYLPGACTVDALYPVASVQTQVRFLGLKRLLRLVRGGI